MIPSTADALAIWQAGVNAVRPEVLLPGFLQTDADFRNAIHSANRIIVVGGGKAGAGMAAALEHALPEFRDQLTGILNVPADALRPLNRLILHPGRPAGSNHPTADGVAGVERMITLLRTAGPNDVAICLISGGGSALLPAPDGVTLEEKQIVTKLLHGCGATINQMNTVRKHLSRVKGGRLAQAFTGARLFSLIISDVINDPLDVIASGPTVVDPSTFADALTILEQFGLKEQTPAGVWKHLERGAAGEIPETMKTQLSNVRNVLLGNNALALTACEAEAISRGYRVHRLGSALQGEASTLGQQLVAELQEVSNSTQPVCLLGGGETTVTLGKNPGKGGRNQELVLAMLHSLGEQGIRNRVILSGGTDGEDGPTDAAGAVADENTWKLLQARGINLEAALAGHSAYDVFDPVNALIKTGLTNTNVMDIQVLLSGSNR